MRKLSAKPYEPKESLSQSAVMDWAKVMRGKWPELEMLFAVPNGFPLLGMPLQTKFKIIAWMKAQGLKKGVPDLLLLVRRHREFDMHPWSGCIVEMKTSKGVLSDEQNWWIAQLGAQGYLVHVCRSAKEAIQVFERYLNLPKE